MKTLKSQLLKKLMIKFYETQDLSSTNGKAKLLFYDYSWHIFFLQPIAEGNCVSSTPPPWIQNSIKASALYIEMLKMFTVNVKQGSNCRQKKPPKMNNSKYTV